MVRIRFTVQNWDDDRRARRQPSQDFTTLEHATTPSPSSTTRRLTVRAIALDRQLYVRHQPRAR